MIQFLKKNYSNFVNFFGHICISKKNKKLGMKYLWLDPLVTPLFLKGKVSSLIPTVVGWRI